jgi:hypothetical protein
LDKALPRGLVMSKTGKYQTGSVSRWLNVMVHDRRESRESKIGFERRKLKIPRALPSLMYPLQNRWDDT